MRRMYSDGQVVRVVNKAIDDGEIVIEAGGLPGIESGDAGKALIVNADETGVEWATVGLRPKDKEKLDNSLQLPKSTPAAQQLVGINTSGEQNALGLGDGLSIDNNTLKVGEPVLVIDFHNAAYVINEEAKAALMAGTYNIVKIINYNKPNANFEFKRAQITAATVSSAAASDPIILSVQVEANNPTYILSSCAADIVFNSNTTAKNNGAIPALGFYKSYPNGHRFVTLSYTGSSIRIVSTASTNNPDFTTLPYTSQVLQLAGGTLSYGDYPTLDYQWNGEPRPYNNLTYEVVDSNVDANAHILMRVSRYNFSTATLYIFGQYINDSTGAVVASYTGTINCQNGVYTITKHAA